MTRFIDQATNTEGDGGRLLAKLDNDFDEMKDGSIIPKILVGKNKYDVHSSENITGYYMYNSGAVHAHASFMITDYIKVSEFPSLTASATYKHTVTFYDAEKVIISVNPSTDTVKTFAIPVTAVYIRCNVALSISDTYQIEDGSSLTDYEEYYEYSSNPPENGSITPIKLSEYTLEKSHNLFNINASDNLLNYYVLWSNGVKYSSTIYNLTGFIDVSEFQGGKITMTYKHNIAFYDINRVYISGTSSADANTTQDVPATAHFVRCTVINNFKWEGFQVRGGETLTQAALWEEFYRTNQRVPFSKLFWGSGYKNILIPKKQYFLKGVENNIYFRALLKSELDNNVLCNPTNFKNYENLARITPTVDLVAQQITNYDSYSIEKEAYVFDIVVGDPVTDNGLINVSTMGDSFMHGGKFLKEVYNICPNLAINGMRNTDDEATYPFTYNGTGGFKLEQYFDPIYENAFSPFMHIAGYTYFGTTQFWYDAYNTQTYFNQYYLNKFNEIGFDQTTGVKTTPAINDLMYFTKSGEDVFKFWNGSSWEVVSLDLDDFEFDYSKYSSTWNIATPDVFIFLLGLNDFRGAYSTVLSDAKYNKEFKPQLDIVIASILVANPSCKFALQIPVSTMGSADNNNNSFVASENVIMSRIRELFIDDYDDREAENIYVVDSGSAVDDKYGFQYTTEKPFDQYIGSALRTVQTSAPHPSTEGFKQIGTRVAAFIQSLR